MTLRALPNEDIRDQVTDLDANQRGPTVFRHGHEWIDLGVPSFDQYHAEMVAQAEAKGYAVVFDDEPGWDSRTGAGKPIMRFATPSEKDRIDWQRWGFNRYVCRHCRRVSTVFIGRDLNGVPSDAKPGHHGVIGGQHQPVWCGDTRPTPRRLSWVHRLPRWMQSRS